MTDRIAAVLSVTALDWNSPGLEPGFCWSKYGTGADTTAVVRSAANIRIDRSEAGTDRNACNSGRTEIAAL